jgi:hypothetical protein
VPWHVCSTPCTSRTHLQATFEDCFAKQYAIIHRLETNKLRNVAKLFAHLLANDAISWGVMQCIRLTEDDTTSSSRIFIKYLFQVRGLLSTVAAHVKCKQAAVSNSPQCQKRLAVHAALLHAHQQPYQWPSSPPSPPSPLPTSLPPHPPPGRI